MTYISMNRDVNSSRDQNVRILWRSRWRRSIDWLHAIQQKGRHLHSMCIRHRMYFCPANFIIFIILSIKAVCIKMNKLCAPVYLDICIHGYVYIYHYTWEGTQIQICINVCTHMHIYACTREYSTGISWVWWLICTGNLQNFIRVFQKKHRMFITELKKNWPVNLVVIWYVDTPWNFKQWCDCYLITFNIYVSSKVKFISAKTSNF